MPTHLPVYEMRYTAKSSGRRDQSLVKSPRFCFCRSRILQETRWSVSVFDPQRTTDCIRPCLNLCLQSVALHNPTQLSDLCPVLPPPSLHPSLHSSLFSFLSPTIPSYTHSLLLPSLLPFFLNAVFAIIEYATTRSFIINQFHAFFVIHTVVSPSFCAMSPCFIPPSIQRRAHYIQLFTYHFHNMSIYSCVILTHFYSGP